MRTLLVLSLALAVPLVLSSQGPPETYDACLPAVQDTLRAVRAEFELTGMSFAMSSGGNLNCAAAIGFALSMMTSAARLSALPPTTALRAP